jgi:subtilisin-like proprotein convertase family protein
MKKLILIVFVVCFVAGVVMIATGKLRSQDVQNQEKVKKDQIGEPIPPKPKVDFIPLPVKTDTSSGIEGQKIFRLKVWMKSEQEQKIVERIGLACEGKTECICHATEEQVEELKKEGIEFKVEGEALRIRKTKDGKGQVYDYNDTPYDIPDNDGWVCSPITISTAPAGATVTKIDVCYDIIHTYIGDLIVDLTDQDLTYEHRLWDREGGSGDNISDCDSNITTFNGELVNQTWYLWAQDCDPGDVGYIDCWEIWIWYEELLPDLIVQSLTASDYNPSKNFQKNR